MKEARDSSSVRFAKIQEQEGGYSGSTKRQKESPPRYTDGHVSPEKMRSWNQNYRKYKGRVVLPGDIVKDDSGAYAVFTEQGSSASQMTTAKIMDVIARSPGCDGQAADAVSAYTQVKLEDAPRRIRLPRHNGPNHGKVLKIPWYFLNEPCMVTPSWIVMGVTIRGCSIGTWMGESTELGMCVRSSKTRIILIGIRG